jgi:hypothetical protein
MGVTSILVLLSPILVPLGALSLISPDLAIQVRDMIFRFFEIPAVNDFVLESLKAFVNFVDFLNHLS